MRQTTQTSGRTVVAALALALFASPLVASVDFDLNGVGSGGSLDGIYTSPYQASISGITGSVSVICDDFANNSYVPEDWTANVTTLSSINLGTATPGDLKWNNAVSGAPPHRPRVTGSNLGSPTNPYAAWNLANQETAYDVAADLTIQLMNATAASTASEELSYALWELFDATGASTANPSLPSNSDQVAPWLTSTQPDPTTLSAATAYVEAAIDAVCGGPTRPNCSTTGGGVTTLNNNVSVSALDGYNVNIYTIVPGTTPTCFSGSTPVSCGSTPPQEFLTVDKSTGTTYNSNSVPEPSSLGALGVYFLFGGGSLLFFGRRRIFRTGN